MKGFNGKKKLTINLSLFTNLADSLAAASSCLSPNKSPRIFQNTSVVGLSIVAAMMTNNPSDENILSSSSRPVPIVCSSAAAKKPRVATNDNIINDDLGRRQVDELSESYTCVISHFGSNLVHKRVFFDDDDDDDEDDDDSDSVFFASSSPMNVGFEIKREFWSRDFLSSCFLCCKKLHGLDVFMYRGENAFAAQNAGTSTLEVMMISKRIVDSKPGNSLITLPPPALGHSRSSPPELPWHEQNFKKYIK